MTERDLSEMPNADLQRHLERYRGIKEFWDDNDRNIVGKLEAEIAKRGARSTP